jgi:hypothetical protein
MSKVVVNGKEVEIIGVSVEKLTTEKPAGIGEGKGISGAIRAMIDAEAKVGNGVPITVLADNLVKAFPALKGQQRQRVENCVKNSNGKYEKRWDKVTGLVAVVRTRK